MKPVIILLAVCIYGITGETADEWNQKVFVAAKKCKEEHNIDDETFNGVIKNRDIPDSPNGKCFMSCVLDNLGFVKDGKISVELLKEKARDLYKNEDLEKALKAHDICHEKGDVENFCESGYIISLCSITEFEKAGLHIH